jgi:hypothetical protein
MMTDLQYRAKVESHFHFLGGAMFRILMAAVGLAAMICGPAAASVVQVTFTGTIDSGYSDPTNTFALGQGADLSGQAVTVTYTYDTDVGTHVSDGTSDELYGGAGYGVAGSPVASTVEVNGVTQSLAGDYISLAYVQGDPNPDYAQFQVVDYSGTDAFAFDHENSVDCFGAPGSFTPDVTAGFSLAGTDTVCTGSTYISTFDKVAEADTDSVSFTSTFTAVSFVTLVAPVPLPATAGMLAGGLAALVLVRRRKARVA